MTPTIGGSERTMDTDEPGGATCYKCHESIQPDDHVYREVFGTVDRTTDTGVVFGTTGGVVVRHWCEDCYREHRTSKKATTYQTDDPDELWAILAASNGQLVADLSSWYMPGPCFVRVRDGELEAATTNAARPPADSEYDLTFESVEWDDAYDLFLEEHLEDNTDPERPIYLVTADETPFRDLKPDVQRRSRRRDDESSEDPE